MKMSNGMKWALCVVSTVALSVAAFGQSHQTVPPGFVRLDPDQIKGGAVLGDPTKPGMYVTHLRFKPGQGSRPHYHSQDRYVTVLKGTWWVSLGPEADVYNPDKMTPVKAGGFVFHPAGGHHYDQAKDEEVLVQIIGQGPVETVQLEAAGRRP